jgi:hypothetical protein
MDNEKLNKIYVGLPETKKIQEEAYKDLINGKDKWEQVRISAAISVLNSLLETTQHSVMEEVALRDMYARVAVSYADSLVKELRKNPDWFEKLIEI